MAVFSLSGDDKGKTLAIIFNDGSTEIVSESHVSFKALLSAFLDGGKDDEQIRELAHVKETIKRKLTSLSERVSVLDDQILFDGDEINGHLIDVIKDLFTSGESVELAPLVKFLEKASTNPSLESVDGLYRWINNRDLVIDEDGDVIAYKGVVINPETGVFQSVHSGTAFVDGEEVKGQIPNVPGTVVSMPRSLVDDGSYGYCSTGLHVGTHSFAEGFVGSTGRVILVKFNPRDVVAVPTEASSQKMRVCKYEVVSEAEGRLDSRIFKTDAAPTDEVPDVADEVDEDEFLHKEEDFFDPAKDEQVSTLGSALTQLWASPLVRDPQTGRFLKGGKAPRDPKTGRFLSN